MILLVFFSMISCLRSNSLLVRQRVYWALIARQAVLLGTGSQIRTLNTAIRSGLTKSDKTQIWLPFMNPVFIYTLCRQVRHGSPENGENERHAGDLGNITAGPDGRATFRIVDSLVKAGILNYFVTVLMGKGCGSGSRFFHLYADRVPDPALHQSDVNLRPLVYRPTTAPFLSFHASVVGVHGPPWLQYKPLHSAAS